MHFRVHPPKEILGQAGRWQSFYHDVMIEHDKHVGQMLDLLDELGIADDTIVMYSTDNGPHMNTWPDGAMTPFRNEKNSNWEGAFRVPELVRWPGKIKAGSVSNEIISHTDWLPTLLAAAGEPEIVEKLKQGHQAGDKHFKVHIDGYNFLPYLTGQEEKGPRPGLIYFSDDGDLVGLRYDNWKIVFAEQRATRDASDLDGAVRLPAHPQDLQPADGSLRAGRHHLQHLLRLDDRPRLPHVCGSVHREGVPGDLQGVPAAHEGGQLHDRPGVGEDGGVASRLGMSSVNPWADAGDVAPPKIAVGLAALRVQKTKTINICNHAETMTTRRQSRFSPRCPARATSPFSGSSGRRKPRSTTVGSPATSRTSSNAHLTAQVHRGQMLQTTRVLADLGILTFVVATMTTLGMRLTIGQIVGPLRGGLLPMKALLASFVLVPALAVAIRAVFPLSDGFGIGLILMATAAGAPFLPPLVQIAKGEVAASVGVLVLLMGATVLYLPVVLPLLLPGVQVSPLDIAKSLVLLMLIPLAIGLFVNGRFPPVAARWQRTVSMIGNVGLLIGVVALLVPHGRALLGTFGTGAVTAAILLAAGTLLIGWLTAGSDAAARPVLALGTGARNIPAALVVADLNFDDPDVLVMCVLFAVVSLAGLLIAARLLGRRAQS